MNIVFLSEQQYNGRVPNDFDNMRTEYAWVHMLEATHANYRAAIDKEHEMYSVVDNADLVICIPSKTQPETLKVPFILKDRDIKTAIMQEGPATLWQNWPMDYQFLYLSLLKDVCEIVFCHNHRDREYFEGLTETPVIILPTSINVPIWRKQAIKPDDKDELVFLGGNMTRWYRGMDSYFVADQKGISKINVPTMGRRQPDEEEKMPQLDERINYVPYKTWSDFMLDLAEAKYAVHMMDVSAAGSFALNCAVLGIPCIGVEGNDTQEGCFPDLTVEAYDLKGARDLMARLQEDEGFYNDVRKNALQNVELFDTSNNSELIEQISEVLYDSPQ